MNALIQLVEHRESDPVTLSVEERDRITRLLPKATITPVPGSSDSYTIVHSLGTPRAYGTTQSESYTVISGARPGATP